LARSNEPFWWSLFAAGGVVAAFLVPVHIMLTGIVAPAGWGRESFEYHRVLALVSHPLSRLYLFVLISLPLFHWAHRFRFTLIDLGLTGGRGLVAVACYGSAIVGAILTAVVLVKL
jgi:succinate dehydrogenase subunit D